jgi:predicted O-methyltransferase YrrM
LPIARRRLRPGGLFITDNMLWDGRVLDTTDNDAATKGVSDLTRELYAASDFATTLVPMRDGVTIAVKLAS